MLKNMALANLSNYYTWKSIKSKYIKNKFKLSTPAWNDTFDLLDGAYSIADIQVYHQKTRNFDWKSASSNLPK